MTKLFLTLFALPLLLEAASVEHVTLNVYDIYNSSPIIYSILLLMSLSSIIIWLYTILTFRKKELMPPLLMAKLHRELSSKNWSAAINLCQSHRIPFTAMVETALKNRQYGPEVMIEALTSEGKRATAYLWQRLSILTDLIYVAPMFGLLGTVLGMFYAFYDLNRSMESIVALFDGLGISVGSTVAGLIVAILSVVFHASLRYHITNNLNHLEKEALSIVYLIEPAERK